MLASLRHARSVLALVLVPSVVGACTSFGAEASGDASAPPDPPPVLPDGARPDPPMDAAGVDATPVDATFPVDAGADAAPTPRACTGTPLFAADFEQDALPAGFMSIDAVPTYVTAPVGFTTRAARYDIGGNLHAGYLRVTRTVPMRATCVQARMNVDVPGFTTQGLEVDFLRLTLSTGVVRVGVGVSGGYLIVGAAPAATFPRTTLAGAHTWVLRTSASKTWLEVDDVVVATSNIVLPVAATATLEIGLDASRGAPTSSPTSNVIFDDVFATYE